MPDKTYTVQKLYDTIANLVKLKAVHRKRGVNLESWSDTSLLAHAAEELVELACKQDDQEELADLMCILVHYMVRKSWTIDDIVKEALNKLEKTFKE